MNHLRRRPPCLQVTCHTVPDHAREMNTGIPYSSATLPYLGAARVVYYARGKRRRLLPKRPIFVTNGSVSRISGRPCVHQFASMAP